MICLGHSILDFNRKNWKFGSNNEEESGKMDHVAPNFLYHDNKKRKLEL